MRTTAARWWAPAVTPAAIGLIALGSTSVALAGIDLTSTLREPEQAAAPIETELTPVTPVDDGGDAPVAAPADGEAPAPTEQTVDDAADAPAPATPPVDVDDVADVVTEVVEDASEAVTDVGDVVDDLVGAPGIGLGPRASTGQGDAHRAEVGGGSSNAGGNGNENGGGRPDAPPGQAGRDDVASPGPGAPNQPTDQPDAGDDQHPSGRDRSVEPGGSGTQGAAQSDPDDDGRGPDRSNGGPDRAGGTGGVDRGDQDGNNGCGNDDDFEDDNEGWCGRRPRPQAPASSATSPPPKGEDQPERASSGGGGGAAPEAARTSDSPPVAEERDDRSSSRSRNARRQRGASGAAAPASAAPEARSDDDSIAARDEVATAAEDGDEQLAALSAAGADDETRAQATRTPVRKPEPVRDSGRVSARSGAGARIAQLLDGNAAGRVVLSTASTVSGAALAFTGLDGLFLALIGAGAIGGGLALLRLSKREGAVSRSDT